MSSLCVGLFLKIVAEVFATFFSSLFPCTMFLPFPEPPSQLSLCLMRPSEENRQRFAMAGFEKAVSLSLSPGLSALVFKCWCPFEVGSV